LYTRRVFRCQNGQKCGGRHGSDPKYDGGAYSAPQSPNWNNGVRREREKEGSGGWAGNGEERGGWEERGRENVKADGR